MFNDLIKEASGELYPVFVVMSHSESFISTVIRKITKQSYSHASVAFDTSLKNMYSFGSGKLSRVNYLVGGFAKEDFKDFSLFAADTGYTMYVSFVTEADRDAMLAKLKELSDKNATKELKYNFIGLLFNAFNKAHDSSDTFFCSQFVDVILKAGNVGFAHKSSLVRPGDFVRLKSFQFVTRGVSANYSQEKVNQKMATITAKADLNVIYEGSFENCNGHFELA
jgi:hypothetical protein